MSSLSFIGNSSSYLRIPNTPTFDFGTGDFTIEWYQYQRDNNPYPRIFQVGNYGTTGITIGLSIEGGNIYYWRPTGFTLITTLSASSYKNKWVHFAISRSSQVTKFFINGVTIGTLNDTTDYHSTEDLVIANESTGTNNAAFGGYIMYFTWVKGVAIYTSNFTVSNDYPTLTSDYVLLLKSSSFDGTLGNTVINNNVSTNPNVPPNFGNHNPFTLTITNMRPMFSNNALRFYKPGSLASCGVGSVRNSSIKSKKI